MENKRKTMEVSEKKKGEETSYNKKIQTREDIKTCIIDMVNRIKEDRFLKAIYISLLEYLEENEPG